ncbi:MAG: TonB-dependent receptor, partial [Bacteroidota bacterium]
SNFEPRFSFKYQLNEKSSIKGSFARTAQYIHLISNTTASVPIDVWTPSTNNIQPQTANQAAIGYFRNFSDNAYEFSLEAYYKEMDNIVDYIDGADLVLNEFLEGEILPGTGRAYGLEAYLEKKKGDVTGWISYTLGRSELQVEGINEGEWYPNRFDQTHSLSIVGFYQLSKRWSFGANFALNSGTPTTFPTSRFEQQGYIIPDNAGNTRNNVRIPAYHRLDFSATLDGKDKPDKRWKGQWVFSVYNLYNRRNPFSIFFRQEVDRVPIGNPVMTEAIRLAVIGSFIPSVSYNFSF